MQTSTDDGKVFELRAESEADQLFIEALDMQGTSLRWERMVREPIAVGCAFSNVGAVLRIDPQHPASVRADAARQVLSALANFCAWACVRRHKTGMLAPWPPIHKRRNRPPPV